MKCEKCQELRLAAERTAAEEAEMEQHLAECVACRQDAAEEAGIWDALRSLPEEELPAGYHAELMQKLRAEQKVVPIAAKKKSKKQIKWKQMSLAAAAVLLVVAAGGKSGILEMRQNSLTTAAQMEQAMDTAANENLPAPAAADAGSGAKPRQEMKAGDTAQAQATPAVEPAEEQAGIRTQEADMAEGSQPIAGVRGTVRIQAAERLSLAVDGALEVRTAILEALEAMDGYEEETDAADCFYAVVPIENCAAFREKLAEIGDLQELESLPAQEQDAFRVMEIRLDVQ